MATTKEYKEYLLEQLELLDDIMARSMMGEYLLYYHGTLFGGIYDERLLIKKAKTNHKYKLPEVIPYKNAKPMYYIEDIEDKEKTKEIILETCKGLESNK